ncbi:MAG: DUF1109 family protein [Myxococcales bacterium]|nr:MAG: DUF1109 family protein [Myxococcales bacterium]
MSRNALDCAEIRNGFVAGRLPAGPEVDAHLQSCPACSELFSKGAQLGRQLAAASSPMPEPGELFAAIHRGIERESGLRATLRALPSRVRAGALLGVALALLVYELAFNRREDFAEFSPLVFWAVVALLGAAVAVGALRLMRGATLPVGSAARERGVAAALLVLPAVALLVVPIGSRTPEAAEAFGNPMGCFSYGAALVVPFALLYWLFERRDAVPVTSLVSAGALAGIAANLLLHAHCPSAHVGHLLLGHASIGAAWALALGLFSRPSRAAQ